MCKRVLSIISAAFLVCLLLACADNSSSPPPGASTGTFSDAGLVSGLQYSTATQTGVTNSQGQFYYMPGETVTFSVGGIALGQATAAASLNTFNLVGISPPLTGLGIPNKTPASNSFQQAANISIFLQTIDSDGNASNGIAISSQVNELAAKTSLNFKQSSDNFQTYFAFRKFIGSCRAAGLWGGSKQIIVTSYAIGNLYSGLSLNVALYGEATATSTFLGSTSSIKTAYDTYGNTIKTEFFNGNGVITGYTTEIFDINGNRTKRQTFDANGNSNGYSTFAYDSNGNNTEASYYSALNVLSEKLIFSYDLNGSLIKEQTYNSSLSLTLYNTYSYDLSGNKVKAEYFNANDVLQRYILYTYDANNNQTSIKPYSANGTLTNRYIFSYDANNNLIKSEAYDPNNVLTDYTTSTYDSYGNRLSQFTYDGNNSLQGRMTFTYDSNGYTTAFQQYDSSNTMDGSLETNYDLNGNPTTISSNFNGNPSTTTYTYGPAFKGWGVIFKRFLGVG